jgi:hypothetical protein
VVSHSILTRAFTSVALLIACAGCTATLDADELYFADQAGPDSSTSDVSVTLPDTTVLDAGPADATPDTGAEVNDVPVVVDVPDIGPIDTKQPPNISVPGTTCNVSWTEEDEICGLALPEGCAKTCQGGWVFNISTTADAPAWTFSVNSGYSVEPFNSNAKSVAVSVNFPNPCDGKECGETGTVKNAKLDITLNAEGATVEKSIVISVEKNDGCPAMFCQ